MQCCIRYPRQNHEFICKLSIHEICLQYQQSRLPLGALKQNCYLSDVYWCRLIFLVLLSLEPAKWKKCPFCLIIRLAGHFHPGLQSIGLQKRDNKLVFQVQLVDVRHQSWTIHEVLTRQNYKKMQWLCSCRCCDIQYAIVWMCASWKKSNGIGMPWESMRIISRTHELIWLWNHTVFTK